MTSDFSYTITRPVNCPSGNAPISGVYQGYFWIKFNPPRKILENKMHLYFTEHNGKYLVSGAGTNRLGPYDLEGIYDPTTLDLTCIKKYHPAPPKPRQSESSSHDSRVARSVCVFSIIHSQTTTNDVPSTVTPSMQNCFRLHMKLMNHKWASPFLHPVDPVALHIPDYFSIIKNPMDFGTIYARLLDGSLATEAEYLELVRRVFDNAILYNKPSDDVAVMAHTLSDYFERERLHMSELVAVEGDAETKELSRGYSYLLSMKMWSLTKELVEKLKKDLAAIRAELETLKAKTPQAIWEEDLDAFVEELFEVAKTREGEE